MENKKIAWAVLAVSVVFSLLFGGYRSLSSEYRQAERIFYDGVEGDGVGILSDLSAREDAAYNLATIAKRYLDEDDPAIQAVLDARSKLGAASSISERYTFNEALTEAVNDLSLQLEGCSLSEKDESYRAGLMAELKSRQMSIGYDGYNAAAAEYKSLTKSFPASLIAGIFGIDSLELFR